MIEVNGMAHVILSLSRFEDCYVFYDRILAFLGLTKTFDGEDMLYYVGGRTALGISRCAPEFENDRVNQNAVGMHHLCFRARTREDIDAVHQELISMGATIVHGPEDGKWAPGYYSVLFEDPVGTRLEVNHVPGEGLLARNVEFEPGDDYR